MKALFSCAFVLLVATVSNSALAFELWLHSACGDPARTTEMYRRANDVYAKWNTVKRTWYEANTHVGHGVIAEFENRLNKLEQLKPYEFRYVLQGYKLTRIAIMELVHAIDRMQAVDDKCVKVRDFEAALAHELADSAVIASVSQVDVSFADAANLNGDSISQRYGSAAVKTAWRSELEVLITTLDQVIRGLRDTIPAAEKGNAAATLLSGRGDFGKYLLQFTDMLSRFDRFYVVTVLATIRATIEVYPAGYDWIVPE